MDPGQLELGLVAGHVPQQGFRLRHENLKSTGKIMSETYYILFYFVAIIFGDILTDYDVCPYPMFDG